MHPHTHSTLHTPTCAVKSPGGAMLRDYKYRAQKKGTHAEAFPPSHCKILLAFSDGTALAFDEWRR